MTTQVTERVVHLIVPDSIDDPARPSGGNAYDRKLCNGLALLGWAVTENHVQGAWPRPEAGARASLARAVAEIPDGSTVLIDGLIASCVPEVLVPHAARLRQVVLVHMPLFEGLSDGSSIREAASGECAVLAAASAVITTSDWTRQELLRRYPLAPERVAVAEPGVDPAPVVDGGRDGVRLLCVAALTPGKGHDVLLGALSRLRDRPWRCTLVGSVDRDRSWTAGLHEQATRGAIGDRVDFRGALARDELDREYARTDLLVLPSRSESYGMVVTESLACGIPVIATSVGGVPQALGSTGSGRVPGLLIPPDDEAALAEALRAWLTDARLRSSLRGAAVERRKSLTGWSATCDRASRILSGVQA